MLTRIGDFAQHNRTTQLLLDAQTRTREAQIQISTGKVASRFRDIAGETNRLVSAKDALQRIQQYQSNNELVDQRLTAMESSTSSLVDIGTRLKSLLIQRLDSGQGVPGVMTPEAQQLLNQAVADLNAKLGDSYLFGGSQTDTSPVVLDPAFSAFGAPDDTYYRGDGVQLTVRADVDQEVTYGMTADRSGFQELIGALRAAIEGDGTNDQAMLENALGLVDSALPKVADYQSEIGAHQAALERINTAHGDAEVYLGNQISDIEDVDVSEAVTRMTQDQMVVESALATIARLSQLSLADFLR
jgi:flagellar hook-associated protein 3 FlgL